MSKSYVIQWKSKLNGRAGKGTKLFDWDEATGLAKELNREYPDILHETIEAAFMETTSPIGSEPEGESAAGPEAPQTNHSPDPAFSFE
jgi:hypothetical protein